MIAALTGMGLSQELYDPFHRFIVLNLRIKDFHGKIGFPAENFRIEPLMVISCLWERNNQYGFFNDR